MKNNRWLADKFNVYTGFSQLMENPWFNLPKKPPFCFSKELLLVERFNETLGVKYPKSLVRLNVLPEAFIGDLSHAEVIVLMTNPGWSDLDPGFHQTHHQKIRNNLLQQNLGKYPLYSFDPKFSNTGGGRYWIKRFREIIEIVGLEVLAKKMVFLEYFPYHSESYYGISKRLTRKMIGQSYLDGQLFNFHLVKTFLMEDKLVIGARSVNSWKKGLKDEMGVTRQVLDKIQIPNLNTRTPYFNQKQLGHTFCDLIERLQRE